MTWTGTKTNQQLLSGDLTLHVNRVRKGHWFWSLTKPVYTVGAKVRKDMRKVESGVVGCRKCALNEVLVAGAREDVRLWGGKKRLGRHVRV